MRVGGVRIDKAVAEVFLEAVAPAGMEAAVTAQEEIEAQHEASLAQWRLQVERAQYEAQRAERRFRAVEPENRLVARTLESEWEKRLGELATAEAELAERERQTPKKLTDAQRARIRDLGADLKRAWEAPTTNDRDRKELLGTLLEEVCISIDKEACKAHLTLRWRGGALSELEVGLRSCRQPPLRTDESTIDLIRRLAVHYPDAMIAGILNRQGRRTVRGERFTAHKIGCLRRYRNIPKCKATTPSAEGELVTVAKAAEILRLAPSTLHRWLMDGFIVGEQITPGAPWRIRMTEELRGRFVEEAPQGYVPIVDAMRMLGVSRQTVLQRVKRGELEAVHVRCGRRKGLRIKVIDLQPSLFDDL